MVSQFINTLASNITSTANIIQAIAETNSDYFILVFSFGIINCFLVVMLIVVIVAGCYFNGIRPFKLSYWQSNMQRDRIQAVPSIHTTAWE